MIVTSNGKIVCKHGLSAKKSPCYLEIYRINGDHFLKNIAFSEGDQIFGGDL